MNLSPHRTLKARLVQKGLTCEYKLCVLTTGEVMLILVQYEGKYRANASNLKVMSLTALSNICPIPHSDRQLTLRNKGLLGNYIASLLELLSC